jgi:hypothetical protein
MEEDSWLRRKQMKKKITELQVKSPIKIEIDDLGNYAFVIHDSDDVYHFFLKDGTYDGYDRPGKCREGEENEPLEQ